MTRSPCVKNPKVKQESGTRKILFITVQVLPIMSDFKLEAVLPGNPIIVSIITNFSPGTQPPKGWGEKRKRAGCSGCLCRWRRRRDGGEGGEEEEVEQGWSGTQTTLLDRFLVLLILICKTPVATRCTERGRRATPSRRSARTS